jgi:hypothetical protein
VLRVVVGVGLVPLGGAVAALGAVVHPATVDLLGVPLPVGLAIALTAEAALLLGGAAAVGSRWGAAVPAVAWLLVVFGLSVPRPEGDLIVAANPAGYAFLLLGAMIAAVGVGVVPLVAMDPVSSPHSSGDQR